MARDRIAFSSHGFGLRVSFISFWICFLPSISLAYRPGEIVPMSKAGQYHAVLIPISKPTGFTGADPYKISFQVGHEKFYVPWLYVINRKSSEVPLIDFHLRYSGNDLHGVTAKVIDMPHHYIEAHPDIRKHFWDPENWPKYVLVRYTWEEQSEIDVAGGFYVLFGSGSVSSSIAMACTIVVGSLSGIIMAHSLGLAVSFILAIYVLQSSKEKLTRFVRENVAETSMPGGVAKVE